MSRAGVREVIRRTLEAGYGDTQFTKVYGYDVTAFGITLGGPIAAFWFSGEGEKENTLTQVTVKHDFELLCAWPADVPSEVQREAVDTAVWDACRDVQAAFMANAHLDENCEAISFGLARADYETVGNAVYRVLRLTLSVWNLNEETISQ